MNGEVNMAIRAIISYNAYNIMLKRKEKVFFRFVGGGVAGGIGAGIPALSREI